MLHSLQVSVRDLTKRLTYACLYGAERNKLAEILLCSVEKATDLLKKYKLKFPSINNFSKTCQNMVQKYGVNLKLKKMF